MKRLADRSDSDTQARVELSGLLSLAAIEIDITPRAAEFLLWLFLHPAASKALKQAVEKARLELEPDEVDPEVIADFYAKYKAPDPVAIMKDVTSRRTLRMSFDRASAVANAIICCGLDVAEAELGVTEDTANKVPCFHPKSPISQLIDHFHRDDHVIYAYDSKVVCGQFVVVTVKLLEADLSNEHAVAACHALGSISSSNTHGPGRLIEIQRNQRCFCGEPKKYKKCCKKKREG